MVLIFSEKITPRLHYMASELSRRLGDEVQVTSSKGEALDCVCCLINYSLSPLEKGIHIEPNGLLEEETIGFINPETASDDKGWFVFPTTGGDFPFDILAASFFFLSRYEEYFPFNEDEHGRFPASASLAYKEGQLMNPVVDQWLGRLFEKLNEHYGVSLPESKVTLLPTVDIDMLTAFKYKSLFIHLGAMARCVVKGELNLIGQRLKTLLGVSPDPYETLSLMEMAFNGYKINWFFQVGNRGPFDKNLPVGHAQMQKAIRHQDECGIVGIHPSYESFGNPGKLKQEKGKLEKVLDRPVLDNRFHFLRFRLPVSYRALEKAGIKCDFSMGYADQVGFRAGTAHPFPFYDLEKERCSDLQIFPLIAMDATLRKYMGLSPTEASQVLRTLYHEMGKTGGCFCTLWHNSSISGDWKPWWEMFKDFLKEVGD